MHEWGDEWFQQYGNDLHFAICELDNGLRDLHICVCGKEKYGCYRTDGFSLWNGSWRNWIGDYNYSYPTNPIGHAFWKVYCYFDIFIQQWNNWLGITKLVSVWQKKQINKLFQKVCKKYPDIIDELIQDTDCYMYIKPGKYGDVDGEKIFHKYWKRI